MRHTGSKEELHRALTVQGKHRCDNTNNIRSDLPSLTKELFDGIHKGHPLWQEKILLAERRHVAESANVS